MINLITFILVAYGLTQILCYGKIFDSIRPKDGKLGELFACSMCTGFWVGFILWCLAPFTELFVFDNNILTAFLLGCLSSGTSYILDKLIGDSGFQLAKKEGE